MPAPASPSPGFLITCEGIDGSGKTTLSHRLAEALQKAGHPTVWAVEPTKTWLGETVRRGFKENVPALAEAFLFMADHAAHLETVDRLTAEGKIVVCDRWADSCFAYQGAALKDSFAARGQDSLRWLMDVQRPFNRDPDLTLLLDLPVETALARLAARQELEKFERADFLEVVRGNYLFLAAYRPYYRVLPAREDPDALLALALAEVEAFMASRKAP